LTTRAWISNTTLDEDEDTKHTVAAIHFSRHV